jgi:hypothetical protein
VLAAGLVACGSNDNDRTGTEADGATVTAPTDNTSACTPSALELMQATGRQGVLIEPQLYTAEVGRCILNGHELEVATFDDNAQRDHWVEFVEDLGGTIITGDRWAVGGFDEAATEAFAGALD